MSSLALHLGPLSVDSHKIFRSGVHWLCSQGEEVRANQIIGFCNISLQPAGLRLSGLPPFAEEQELQVAFAPRLPGRIFINAALLRGGYLSMHSVETWNADDIVAHLETDVEVEQGGAGNLRLLMLAGRRMTGLADLQHAGLLPSWHGRSRGWWCDQGETPISLLSLGVCDAAGVITGEKGAFLETFEAASQAAQMVYVPDHPIAYTTQLLLDQLSRTPAQYKAIAADIQAVLAEASTTSTPDDLMFAGTLLQALQRSPITDTYPIFSASGSSQLRPADAILLSLVAEPQTILRHKKLGYHLNILRHYQTAAGPVMREWLGSAFEAVKRSLDDIRRDYEKLIDTMARMTGAKLVIINRMSTQGHEDISSYAPFDAPMSNTLANIAAKEMNLMLHDIAETRDIAIIDVDAIAAEIGGAEHLPDAVHQSGLMQAILRNEILRALEEIRAPLFSGEAA